MTNWIVQLPTWMMIRVLGFGSYLSLFVGVSSGIVHSLPALRPMSRKRLNALHAYANGLGLVLALVHTLLLIVDTYAPFNWTELLVPLAAKQHPMLNGFGTLAVYGLVVVLLTTDLRPRINRRVWHLVHMLAYPIFVMALLHGLGVGTDTKLEWARWMYGLTGLIVLALTYVRIWAGRSPLEGRQPAKQRLHAGSAALEPSRQASPLPLPTRGDRKPGL